VDDDNAENNRLAHMRGGGVEGSPDPAAGAAGDGAGGQGQG
jgi:hypothetical protein